MVDYEKMWDEVARLAQRDTVPPPPYAKSTSDIKTEFGFTRGVVRRFLDEMIREKKLKFWGKYGTENYYVPYSMDDGT